MIGLSRGNYLGQTEQQFFADSIVASITSYPNPGYSESLHYHDIFHLSYILKGGNLEKRTRTEIERLRGVITAYEQGEPHRSTQTLAASKHINLEIGDSFLHQQGIDTKNIDRSFLKTPDAGFIMLK